MAVKKQRYTVIGYADRVEVMSNSDYHSKRPQLRSDGQPDGWTWVHAIDDAPNMATAVYKAALDRFPSLKLRELLIDYLERKHWSLNDDDAKEIENLDRFIVRAGEPSVFTGLFKHVSNGCCYWDGKEASPNEVDASNLQPNVTQLALEIS